eukprot:15324187-Ditylum_brightwellii.AAC.1
MVLLCFAPLEVSQDKHSTGYCGFLAVLCVVVMALGLYNNTLLALCWTAPTTPVVPGDALLL